MLTLNLFPIAPRVYFSFYRHGINENAGQIQIQLYLSPSLPTMSTVQILTTDITTSSG